MSAGTGRLSMLAAVLEARAGIPLSAGHISNVAGGVKISELAADLVAAALISSVTGRPCPRNTVIFGEVGPLPKPAAYRILNSA